MSRALTNVAKEHEIILILNAFVVFYFQFLKTSLSSNNPAEPECLQDNLG